MNFNDLIGNKRILAIIAFTLVVILLGYLIFVLFFKSPSLPASNPNSPNATTTRGNLPIASSGTPANINGTDQTSSNLPNNGTIETPASDKANGSLTKVSTLDQNPGLGATPSTGGNDVQYYNKKDGKFYRINKDGQALPLSDKVFYEVQNVVWAPNKDKAIIAYPDGSSILYDFNSNKQISYPKHWQDYDFSPDGNQVVMKSVGLDPDNRWLAVASTDGSQAQKVEEIGDNGKNIYPSWSPNNLSVAMYVKGKDLDRQELFFIGLNNENFKSTIIEGRNPQFQWTPSGDRLMYSVSSSENDYKPDLWIVNGRGDSIGSGRKNLYVQTWANKCVFANNIDMYCGVPKEIETGMGLADQSEVTSVDELYKIDTQTGMKTLIAVPNGDYCINKPIISGANDNLYFTDCKTQQLMKIRLK